MYQEIGLTLSVSGAILTIVGTLVNNLLHRHLTAMGIWAVSNPLVLVWALGYLAGFWDVGLSMIAVAAMYAVMLVSNWYGLLRDPLPGVIEAYMGDKR